MTLADWFIANTFEFLLSRNTQCLQMSMHQLCQNGEIGRPPPQSHFHKTLIGKGFSFFQRPSCKQRESRTPGKCGVQLERQPRFRMIIIIAIKLDSPHFGVESECLSVMAGNRFPC